MAGERIDGKQGKGWHWARVLFVLPLLAVVWVPFYNHVEPTLFDVPFFYWYQMLWIVLCAAIVSLVYWLEK